MPMKTPRSHYDGLPEKIGPMVVDYVCEWGQSFQVSFQRLPFAMALHHINECSPPFGWYGAISMPLGNLCGICGGICGIWGIAFLSNHLPESASY